MTFLISIFENSIPTILHFGESKFQSWEITSMSKVGGLIPLNINHPDSDSDQELNQSYEQVRNTRRCSPKKGKETGTVLATGYLSL